MSPASWSERDLDPQPPDFRPDALDHAASPSTLKYMHLVSTKDFVLFNVRCVLCELACVAGVPRGRKEERRVREARGDRTREDLVFVRCTVPRLL